MCSSDLQKITATKSGSSYEKSGRLEGEPITSTGDTERIDGRNGEKDQPLFIESLMRNYAKASEGDVSGLGSGTYGLVFTIKGTTEKAIKLLRPDRYLHPGVESEADIGKYTKGMKNVMQYFPVYTREPIGVLMNRLTFDLQEFLKAVHYHRWSMSLSRGHPLISKYCNECKFLNNELRKLDVVAREMIKRWVASERQLSLRGGKERLPLVELEVLSLYVQLSNGLSELHSARFLHGDIKPKNVLVKLPSAEFNPPTETEKRYSCPEGEYFLADLGGAMRWNPGTCGWSYKDGRLPCSTRTIMAPELWRVWYEKKGYILSSSDVWSLGCTMLDVWIFVFGGVSKHPAGYFSLPWMRAAYERDGDRGWVGQCLREACSVWRPRNGSFRSHQENCIDDWDVVRRGLGTGEDTELEGKYELRKSLLYFLFNCLLQPDESLRFKIGRAHV